MTYASESRYARIIRRMAFAAVFAAGLCVPLIPESLPGWAMRPVRRELLRVPCPTLERDAVLLETRAGVMAKRRSYEVYIVGHGVAIKRSAPVMSATRMREPALRWRSANLLEIGYLRARIEQFTNYWPHDRRKAANPVEIHLAPESATYSFLVTGPNSTAPATLPAR